MVWPNRVYGAAMKALNSGSIAGLIVIVACGAQGDTLLSVAQPRQPGVAHFAIDIWPGEGIPVIEMRRAELVLRAGPDPSSAVVDTLRGRVGQRLAFDSTRYETTRPGAFRFTTAGAVTGRDLGDVRHVSLDLYYHTSRPEVSVPVAPSSSIEFLQYRAEGTCFIRLNARVIDAQPCPGFGKDSVEVIREPQTRWWIQVRGLHGRPGWLLVSDSTAQSVRREF